MTIYCFFLYKYNTCEWHIWKMSSIMHVFVTCVCVIFFYYAFVILMLGNYRIDLYLLHFALKIHSKHSIHFYINIPHTHWYKPDFSFLILFSSFNVYYQRNGNTDKWCFDCVTFSIFWYLPRFVFVISYCGKWTYNIGQIPHFIDLTLLNTHNSIKI